MMIAKPRINTIDEAQSLDELTHEWKIIAHSRPGLGWMMNERVVEGQFKRLAFSVGLQPQISVVTGRDYKGDLVLYARVFPPAWRHDYKSYVDVGRRGNARSG